LRVNKSLRKRAPVRIIMVWISVQDPEKFDEEVKSLVTAW
jgi:coenzyme F420-reducing hydrogenase delta subunit